MEQQESTIVQGARVVGIAGIAAGVVGAVLGRMLESRREPTAGERLQAALGDVKATGGKSLTDTLSEAAERARADFEGAAKTSKKRRKQVVGKAQHSELAALATTGKSFTEHMRKAVLDSTEKFGENLHDALEQTTVSLGKGAETSKKRGKRAKKAAKKQRKSVEKQTSEGLGELMKLRREAAGAADDRYHDIEKRARETVEKRVKPALESVVKPALEERIKPALAKAGTATLAGAGEARHWLEEESKELEKRYTEARPKIEKQYAETRPKIEKSAEHYAEAASELLKDIRKLAQEHAPDAEHLLQEGAVYAREGASQARALAHDAGDSAKEGGKNAGSLLVWSAIAGGLIYQVLLDDDQKQKVRQFASTVFHEGKAIYEDLRGENSDFSTQ